VVGFGNSLAGDDGAGPAVIERLRDLVLPELVRAEVCGSDALTLPGLWRGEAEIWLVDGVISGSPPGTVHRLGHREVLGVPQRHATVHSLSLPESLRWLALAYPEMASVSYRLWGIEAARVALVEGLTPVVAGAVDAVAAEICAAARRQLAPGRGASTEPAVRSAIQDYPTI